jgi:hypothetical protein
VIQAALRAPALGQPAELAGAYAVSVTALIGVITTLNSHITTLQGQVEAYFGRHPAAEIYRSQPGLGAILGARVLGEFGDDEFGDDAHRYHDAKARKNYAGTSPITRACGKRRTVSARYARNDRLADALQRQAFSRAAELTRRAGLLRPFTRQPGQLQRRVASTREPAGRDPARLPEKRNSL